MVFQGNYNDKSFYGSPLKNSDIFQRKNHHLRRFGVSVLQEAPILMILSFCNLKFSNNLFVKPNIVCDRFFDEVRHKKHE